MVDYLFVLPLVALTIGIHTCALEEAMSDADRLQDRTVGVEDGPARVEPSTQYFDDASIVLTGPYAVKSGQTFVVDLHLDGAKGCTQPLRLQLSMDRHFAAEILFNESELVEQSRSVRWRVGKEGVYLARLVASLNCSIAGSIATRLE